MFRLTALGVGHGDATLLQWFEAGQKGPASFTCLVDGGESPKKLESALDRHGVRDIDLLVLSHFDADHIGGLDGIENGRRVDSYWAPCLPAFERHSWLFGARIQTGLAHARNVEGALAAQGASVIYPLEGYSSSPLPNGEITLNVLSPAARLIRTLILGQDIERLFTQTPMPLGWLGGPEEPPPVEQPRNELDLDQRLRTGALAPSDVDWIQPDSARPGATEAQREWSAKSGLDPEFFGDSVLNNTSLVIWLNIRLGARNHKILLTGDQENWTYLLMRHPLGLQVDVLKAPHHGGQMFIEQAFSNEEVLSTVRPRALLFSANGRHGLPHRDIREAAMRWGASVLCTSQRGSEVLLTTQAEQIDECCHKQFSCSSATADVMLLFDDRGIHAGRAACHTGFGASPGPIIQIRQHSVERSPVAQHLHEGELRKHITWLKKTLTKIHADRVKIATVGKTGNEPVGFEHLAMLARSAGRHSLTFGLDEVLARAWERNEVWSSGSRYRYGEQSVAYALPSAADLHAFLELVRSKELLLFVRDKPKQANDRSTLLAGLDLTGFEHLCDGVLHFPPLMFRETFWPSVYRELSGWFCYSFSHPSIYDGYSLLALSKSGSMAEICNRLLGSTASSDGEAEPSDVTSPVLTTCEGKSVESWNRAFRSPHVMYSDYSHVPTTAEVLCRLQSLAEKFQRIA